MAEDRVPIKRIVRLTGLSRKLVRQIVRGEREDVFRVRVSSLTPWLPQLEKEWRQRNSPEPSVSKFLLFFGLAIVWFVFVLPALSG